MRMRMQSMGRTGVDVSVVGQGTWQMEHAPDAAIAALRSGIDAGMTHIDTAEMYGSGAVEELVGKAIAGRRDEVYLVSKVLPYNASREGTVRACEGSLRRLHTDHLDLYLLHWPGQHPLEETLGAFCELQEAGKVRAFGVSNFDVDDLEAAEAVVGAEKIACNQVLYHLGQRSIEHAVIPWCRQRDIAVVAYSPLGSGRFPGRTGDRAKVLSQIAKAQGATVEQIALAFVLRTPGVFAIPKACHETHVRDNAAAANIALTPDESAALEAAFQLGPAGRGLPML